jgi:hypothetical protein
VPALHAKNCFLWGEFTNRMGVQQLTKQITLLVNGHNAAVPDSSTFVLPGWALWGL